MKKLYFILTLLSLGLFASAQDSWKIKLNGSVLLSSKAENEMANQKKIQKSKFSKAGTLDILYKESKPMEGWKRSYLLFDENDNELMRIENTNGTTRIKNLQIREKLNGNRKIKIYTIALPTDPDKAAAIRVRRVHLCTLELQ